jgi:7,8-dihydroneopterin 2',3'-cyclic phosphate phosphodiesterase
MDKLIELAKKIKDKKLQQMVIDFIKDPTLSNKEFKKYPRTKVEDVRIPFTVAGLGTTIRDLLNHTTSMVELCITTAEHMKKHYGLQLDVDSMVAAAILHDIMKIYEWKRTKQGPEHSGIMLDHLSLIVAELYHRGFPENLIHIIASHHGEGSPVLPRNFEALIFHQLDTMISLTEAYLYATKHQQQVVVIDEEILKKLGGETEKG